MTTTNVSIQTHKIEKKGIWNILLSQKQLIFMSVPFLIYKLLFNYVPLVGWITAFQDYRPAAGKSFWQQTWVGLNNFKFLFSDATFINDIRNTFAMSLINLVFSFVTAVLLALLLNEVKNLFFKRIIQNVSYLPHFLSWVIVAGLVSNMLSTGQEGVVNQLLMMFNMVDRPIEFLSRPNYFWWIIGVSNVWKELGWNTIIYLATINAIDPALYEAASIDGAGRYRKMLNITLPGIKSTFIILLIMNIGHLLEAGFEVQYLLGNPLVVDFSETIDIFVLKYGIQMNRFALGTAAGIFKSIVSIILVVSVNFLAGKLGEEKLI